MVKILVKHNGYVVKIFSCPAEKEKIDEALAWLGRNYVNCTFTIR